MIFKGCKLCGRKNYLGDFKKAYKKDITPNIWVTLIENPGKQIQEQRGNTEAYT